MHYEDILSGFLTILNAMISVRCVRMSITPQNVILGAISPVSQNKTALTCDSPAGTNIDYISDLRITRKTKREGDGSKQTIVLIREGRGADIPLTVIDIYNRATATGSVDIANRNGASVGLEIDTVAIQCLDEGQYFCELTYDDIVGNKHGEEDSMNFTAIALPISNDFTLTATVNESVRSSASTFPVDLTVGEEIEFFCGGFTGGDPTTQIEWMKSGNSGLIKFVPSSYPNAVETRGQLQPVPDQCTNRRTTKLTYNITSSDANIKNGLLEFMCYAEVTLQGSTVRANSSVFYIHVQDRPSWPSPDTGGTSHPSIPSTENNVSGRCECPEYEAGKSVGIVAGCLSAVIAVLTVALVYLLIQQQKCLKPHGNPTYEIPDRSLHMSQDSNYDALQQPVENYEVPMQTESRTYSNTRLPSNVTT